MNYNLPYEYRKNKPFIKLFPQVENHYPSPMCSEIEQPLRIIIGREHTRFQVIGKTGKLVINLGRYTTILPIQGKYRISIPGSRLEFVLTDEAEIIYTFCESQDKKKLFLVTEKSKLLIFDLQTEKLDAVVTLFTSRPDSYQISSLVCDKDYLWMSTIGGGVLRYHLRNHSLDSFTRNSSSKQYLSHDDVYALIAVGDKYIAATWNGYTVLSLDRKNGGVTKGFDGSNGESLHNISP